MNIENEFEKKSINYDHSNRGWFKSITGLDKSYKNGYSILGEFIDTDNVSKYEDGVYLNCNNGDEYQVVKIENNELTLLKEVQGYPWATKLWEIIEENMIVPEKKSVNAFYQEIKKELDAPEIMELIQRLQDDYPKKANIRNFYKPRTIQDEYDSVYEKAGIENPSEVEKEAIMAQAIIDYHEFDDFKQEDITFSSVAHDDDLRRYELQEYNLFVSEEVDAFAKTENGKIWIMVLR